MFTQKKNNPLELYKQKLNEIREEFKFLKPELNESILNIFSEVEDLHLEIENLSKLPGISYSRNFFNKLKGWLEDVEIDTVQFERIVLAVADEFPAGPVRTFAHDSAARLIQNYQQTRQILTKMQQDFCDRNFYNNKSFSTTLIIPTL